MNERTDSHHWTLRLALGLAFGLAALPTAFAAVAAETGCDADQDACFACSAKARPACVEQLVDDVCAAAGDGGCDEARVERDILRARRAARDLRGYVTSIRRIRANAAGYQEPSRAVAAQRVQVAPAPGAVLQRPSGGGPSHGGPGHEGVPGGGPGGFEVPGGARDYALLKQTHNPSAPHIWGYVLVELDADKGEILDEEWDPSWEYESDTTDNEIRNQVTLEWYGQASCADGIQSMSVNGPGGTESQSLSPGQKTVHGKVDLQSFSVATIKKICVDWAEQTPPGWPMAPMPAQYEDFDLVGGTPPTTMADQLNLNWRCIGGPPNSNTYQPKIRLRCSRQN